MSTRDDPAEVARALAFRESQRRRATAEAARMRALSGSRAARRDLADRWSALDALRPDHLLPPTPVPALGYPLAYPLTYGA